MCAHKTRVTPYYKMKLLSLFSGIGAFEKALDRLKVNYELVNYCEIDKYASKAYAMLHDCDESLNLGDITKIDTSALPNDIDLITYGFPCQDISLAGKQKGFEEDGERTRSGLFFEALRIIEDTKPRIAIAENVKNLTSKKFSEEFNIVLSSLEQAEYNNYWKILNAKDFGIPQNRERVFIVSIRKDIDNGMFKFPEGFELELRLKDMLQDEVDEKYYLSGEITERIRCRLGNKEYSLLTGISTTLTSSNEPVRKYGIFDDEKGKHQAGSVWDKEGLAPTLDTMQGGYRQPCIEEPMICASRGRNPDNPSSRVAGEPTEQRIEVNTKGLANTLTTVQKDNYVLEPQIIREEPLEIDGWHRNAKEVLSVEGICRTLSTQSNNLATKIKEKQSLRIRKLTPLECFRLMGFDDDDFYKIKGISNTQLYKMAGNSIVVDVLKHLFIELLKINILKGIKL